MNEAPATASRSAAIPILVVDDKPANLLALEAVLASPEHELVEARSGRSALQLLEQRDFAVVLLDVQMPDMDGLETAAEMRRIERARHVPVIFVSAVDADPLHVQQAYAGGAVDFIQKPFEPDVIRAKVSAFVELYRARQRIVAEQTKAALATTLRSLGEAVIATDLEARVSFMNEVAERLTGWSEDEALGHRLEDVFSVFSEESGAPRDNPATKVLRDGTSVGMTNHTVLRSRSGQDIPVEDNAAPIVDTKGAVQGAVVVFRDVSSEKRQEARREAMAIENAQAKREAEEARAGYRALIDNLPELAWTARPDGFIDFYNRRWYDYTGTTPEAMQGWGWKAVHHPDAVDAVVERWTRCIDTGEPFEMEFPLRGADGVFRWFLTRIVPMRGPDGAIVRWFGTNTNIDEYRRLRDALASSVENEKQARLEAEAARRHVEELRDEAVTAVKKREQIMAVVSHDLRNPLSTVLLGAKQIERSADESVSGLRTKKMAKSILNAVNRMTRLVGDLFDLAKLEAGQPLPVDREVHDVAALARLAAEQIEPVASSRRLTLTNELAEPAYAFCDAERIQQVLSNLVGNAIKFTREGGAIRMSVRKAEGEVILSVSDTGSGIPAEQLPHLFTPYWHADVGRKDSAGLGLAIVKAIAETHGGRLWVETAVGKGSTFYFTLPAAEPVPQTAGER